MTQKTNISPLKQRQTSQIETKIIKKTHSIPTYGDNLQVFIQYLENLTASGQKAAITFDKDTPYPYSSIKKRKTRLVNTPHKAKLHLVSSFSNKK